MNQLLQLLQQIAHNTERNDSMWVAIIAGGAGVFGAGLTACFSYFIAKKSQQTEEKRLRASVVTTERLRWLQDIRQRLARFYAQLDKQYNHLKRPIPPGETADYQKQLDIFSSEINEQCNVIYLMMNPQKQNQNDLRDAVHEAIGFIMICVQKKNAGSTNFDDNHYTAIKQKAFDSLTKIGTEAWEKIRELG